MKMLRLCVVPCVVAVASSAPGCGEPPTDQPVSERSALVARAPGYVYLGSYVCDGTVYRMGVNFSQTVAPFGPTGSIQVRDGYGYSLGTAVNSTTLSCPSTQMVLRPSTAYTNPTALSCLVVARVPGGGTGYTPVTVPISGMVYWPDAAPIGWPGIPAWSVTYAGGPEGLAPGWCAGETFTFG